MTERAPLTVDRIVAAAAAVADRGGVARVSMRNVGQELGVEAMSLYHHIANKNALLDALADWIFTQIELPRPGEPWREEMRRRAESARTVLAAHPWGLTLIESRRTPGPALLRHHDSVIGCLRRGGFPVPLAARAFSVIDAYVYGFVLTEQNLPFDSGTGASDFAEEVLPPAEEYPHLVELVVELVSGEDYAFANEFAYGLDLILAELDHRLAASGAE